MSIKPVIKRALLSTSDKTGLVEFAQQLQLLGVELIATGNTANLLKNNKISVTDVSAYTGFPEIMNGRVKTLHPKIHAGLLARRGQDEPTLLAHDIETIDLVVVNLYPFAKTIADPKCTLEQAVEQIDVGGPTMLRAAAKNYQDVTVIVDPNDYAAVIDEIKSEGNTSKITRRRFAEKVFLHTAEYDSTIARYLTSHDDALPDTYLGNFHKKLDLRYGENPHQRAAFYQSSTLETGSLAAAALLQGKPLSYNNLIDGEAALNCVREFSENQPACVIVKHATPCGVAIGATLLEAYQKALATDPVSAFGGIVAFNQPLDATTATAMLGEQFVEVLLAPAFADSALQLLQQKSNLRVLACGAKPNVASKQLRSVSGGLLIQDDDQLTIRADQLQIVTKLKPSDAEIQDLLFAWQVVKYVKSNAIVYAKNLQTLGIGTGQTSRVFSAKIAILKAEEAKLSLVNSVMASDAFIPFPDTIEIAANAGIKAVIQTGGSKRDDAVVTRANELNLTMAFTEHRHFKH